MTNTHREKSEIVDLMADQRSTLLHFALCIWTSCHAQCHISQSERAKTRRSEVTVAKKLFLASKMYMLEVRSLPSTGLQHFIFRFLHYWGSKRSYSPSKKNEFRCSKATDPKVVLQQRHISNSKSTCCCCCCCCGRTKRLLGDLSKFHSSNIEVQSENWPLNTFSF